MTLIRIGYWRDEGEPRWPDVRSFVDLGWDVDERLDVADYLRHGMLVRASLWIDHCRFCGQDLGNRELSDGVFLWPEGLAHYVVEHGVRLPARIVAHVAAQSDEFVEARADDRWWGGLMGWSAVSDPVLDLQRTTERWARSGSLDPWTALMRVLVDRLQAMRLPDALAPALEQAANHWSGHPEDLAEAKAGVRRYIEGLGRSGTDLETPDGRAARALLCVLEPPGDDAARARTVERFASVTADR
jgi:hypothetical protein